MDQFPDLWVFVRIFVCSAPEVLMCDTVSVVPLQVPLCSSLCLLQQNSMMVRGGLATWHSPGGPVGLPARWAATSDVEGGSEKEKGVQGPLAKKGEPYLDKVFAGPASSYM